MIIHAKFWHIWHTSKSAYSNYIFVVSRFKISIEVKPSCIVVNFKNSIKIYLGDSNWKNYSHMCRTDIASDMKIGLGHILLMTYKYRVKIPKPEKYTVGTRLFA